MPTTFMTSRPVTGILKHATPLVIALSVLNVRLCKINSIQFCSPSRLNCNHAITQPTQPPPPLPPPHRSSLRVHWQASSQHNLTTNHLPPTATSTSKARSASSPTSPPAPSCSSPSPLYFPFSTYSTSNTGPPPPPPVSSTSTSKSLHFLCSGRLS